MNLSLGIFFDGTANNRLDRPRQKISNVAKLYDVYGQDNDSTTAKLYIRGVGSKKYKADDDDLGGETIISNGIDQLLGGAFGVGGQDRIDLMLKRARKLLQGDSGITKLQIDLFGFSRGAALARHFVNVIRANKLHPKQKIRFLGLFDTVGSFGVPGNNSDPFDFSIGNNHAQFVYQLVAENELRKNFDLHSIRRKPTDPFDFDDSACTGNKWKVEILCPGVHSDIGGSYRIVTGKKPQHGNDNNLLARVYLERMFDIARKSGVPFDHPSTEDRKEFWDVDKDIKSMLSNILGYYKRYPELRTKHAILREAEEYLAVEEYRLSKMRKRIKVGNKRRTNPKYLQRKREVKSLTKTGIPALKDLFLKEVFNNNNDRRNTFLRNYRTFTRRYMHNSHFPSNSTPGMDAQIWPMSVIAANWPSILTDPRASIIKDTFKRDIFLNTAT